MTRPSAEAAIFIVRNVRPLAGPAAPAVALLFHENGHERSSVGVIPAADFSRNQNLSIGLSDLGLANYLLSDADLEQGPIPEATQLLVYEDGGYDEVGGQPPAAVIEHLTEFVARGGGVIFTGVGKESTVLRAFISAHPDRTVSVSINAFQSLVGPNREAIRSSVLRLMPSAADIMAAADERRAAEQAAADAWTAAQPSRRDDVRSIYCNSPTLDDCGGAVPDWMTLAKLLKKAGMTRVDVDICRGMYSAYPSSVLVRQPGLENRDCLAECLAACRRWGLELYAWRCCWKTPEWICTDEMAQRLRNEGRCAINNLGVEETHGGCPTHPDNISVEVESMVELAKSGVDGINFDYIRYNNNNVCFCARCRAKFEEFLGQPVENWPADAYVGGKYFDNKWKEFRCGNISHVVEEIARRVRAEAPGVRISVSGFQTEDAPQNVGQDWAYWCRQGWIDEVDIMAYYDTADQFGTIVGNLMKRDVGSATLRPLIGLNSWDRTGTESKRLAEQILKAREIGCSGWGVFALDDRFIRMLPCLAQGPLSEPSGRPVPKLGLKILFK